MQDVFIRSSQSEQKCPVYFTEVLDKHLVYLQAQILAYSDSSLSATHARARGCAL